MCEGDCHTDSFVNGGPKGNPFTELAKIKIIICIMFDCAVRTLHMLTWVIISIYDIDIQFID